MAIIFPADDQVQIIFDKNNTHPRAVIMCMEPYADRMYWLDVHKKLQEAEEDIRAGRLYSSEEVSEMMHQTMARTYNKAVVNALWHKIGQQTWGELAQYFSEDARIYWRNTNEVFSVDEFLRANSEYPGDWQIRLMKLMESDDTVISVVQVRLNDSSTSFHATSFFTFQDHKIIKLEEYWGDDGMPPAWRISKHIGRTEDPTVDEPESFAVDEEQRIRQERWEARQCGRFEIKYHCLACDLDTRFNEMMDLVDQGETVFLFEDKQPQYVLMRYDLYKEQFDI